jgi:uncharacterized membrane protein YkvA (DUF1232 family)
MNIIQKILSALNLPQHYVRLLEQKSTRIPTIILTLLYMINPFDIIPDFIFGFGIIDDGLLLSLLVSTLFSISKKQKEKKSLT